MNQRKSIGFTMKNIGTNEKKRWLLYEKHRNRIDKHLFYIDKHKNQTKNIGFPFKNIGTNEKASALL